MADANRSISLRASIISPSAAIWTDENEKTEMDQLSQDEREQILRDMHGDGDDGEDVDGDGDGSDVNNDEDSVGDDYDISNDLLNEFHNILQQIDESDKKECMEAIRRAPNVVRGESDPKRFIRAEDYDIEMAVFRFIEYWKMRVEIFKDNAFEPMSIGGTMKDYEINALLQHPMYGRILPKDKSGRHIFCIDKTNVTYKDNPLITDNIPKISWFIIHVLMQNTSVQRNGLVFMALEHKCSGFEMFDRKTARLLSESFDQALPIKIKCIHVYSTTLFAKLALPMIRFFMTRETRNRMQIHTSRSSDTVLKNLETKFGITSNILPTSVGGAYDEAPPWIGECKQYVKERHQRLRLRRKRNYYSE